MPEDPTSAARRSEPRDSGSGAEAAPIRLEQTRLHGKRWGDLVLVEEIGRGSFGTVYKAYDPRLDRAVAVKLLQPSPDDKQLASTLLHEGRTLARVRHPNVVTVYGAGEYDGQIWSLDGTGPGCHVRRHAGGPRSAQCGRSWARRTGSVQSARGHPPRRTRSRRHQGAERHA